MTTQSTQILNELSEISRDGQEFYREASTKVNNPELKKIFLQMADARGALIQDLAEHTIERGEKPAQGGTTFGGLHTVYAKLRACLSTDKNGTYVAELEEAEDRQLDAFTAAINRAESADVRAILSKHLPKVRAMHDQMKALKQRLAA